MNHNYLWQGSIGKLTVRYWQGTGRKFYLERVETEWPWLELGVFKMRLSVEWL